MWPFKKPEKKPEPELMYIIRRDGWGNYTAYLKSDYDMPDHVLSYRPRNTLERAEQDIAWHIENGEKSKTVVVAEYYKTEYPTHDFYKPTPCPFK